MTCEATKEDTGCDADREIVASWMLKNGFATGHGDTIHDLLSELEWQVQELRRHQSSALT